MLKGIDKELYREVKEILKHNKEEGVKRGAMQTRIRWQNKKKV